MRPQNADTKNTGVSQHNSGDAAHLCPPRGECGTGARDGKVRPTEPASAGFVYVEVAVQGSRVILETGTIYVVSSGWQTDGDFEVHGYYSTKALADQAAEIIGPSASVDEYAVDKLPGRSIGL